jgi:branched-subunit amino acid aminotransferase/4-amino-4-deoxychorismate lyase
MMEVIRALGLSIVERTITLADLQNFDAAFVTNAIIEILPVHMLNDTSYNIPELVDALRNAYRQRAEASLFSPDL